MWTCLTSYQEADAETQMALDAELLQACEDAPASAFLRFYRMNPAAVTIGRNQKWQRVVDPAVCAARGWDWVRRPTGGGALLHRHEVNYTVAVGRDELAAQELGNFSSVFAWIARGLSAGISVFAANPTIYAGRSGDSNQPRDAQHGLCGRSLTRYEIGLPTGKIVAAAQMIRHGAVLQHGTVYLSPPDQHDQFWPQNRLLNSSLDEMPGNGPASGAVSRATAEPLRQRWAGLGERASSEAWETVAATLSDRFIQASGLIEVEAAPVPDPVECRLEVRRTLWHDTDWHCRR